MFTRIGPVEILLVLIVLLLLFGAKRIPEIARSLGKSLKEFRTGLKEVDDLNTEKKTDTSARIEKDTENNSGGKDE